MSQKSMKKASARSHRNPATIEKRMQQTFSKIDALCDELKEQATEAGLRTSEEGDKTLSPGSSSLSPSPEPRLSSVQLTKIFNVLEDMMTELNKIIDDFHTKIGFDTVLTGTERRRLFGVRSRKLGFITAARDVADNNPGFIPPNFSVTNMKQILSVLELARQAVMQTEQVYKTVDDFMLTYCDDAYRDALGVYGILQEQARRKVPGADALYQELRQFFTLHRRGRNGNSNGEHPPTIREIERDFKRLMRGKADGTLLVKNTSPHTTGGVREVIDNIHPVPTSGSRLRATVTEQVSDCCLVGVPTKGE